MNKVKPMTIIRTITLIVALINQILTIKGYNILPISDEQISEAVTLIFTVCASLWSWWENNSFTKEAIEADKVYEELKSK